MAVKSSREKPPTRQPASQKPERPAKPRPPRNNDRFLHDLGGIGLVGLGAILLASLVRQHQAGLLGSAMAGVLRIAFGLGAFAVPFLLVAVGVALIVGREQHTRANFSGGAALLFADGISWWHLAHTHGAPSLSHITDGGGYVGAAICAGLRHLLGAGDVSAHIAFAVVASCALVWATDMRFVHILDRAATTGKKIGQPVAKGARTAGRGVAALKDRADSAKERAAERRAERTERMAAERAERERAEEAERIEQERIAEVERIEQEREKPARLRLVTEPEPPEAEPPPMTVPDDDAPTIPDMKRIRTPRAPVVDASQLVIPESLGNDGTRKEFVLPPLTLLAESPPKPIRQEKATAEKQAILMQTLNDFKIGANVKEVSVGPSVTRYEVQLEPGILVKKIVSLADNLAMSLAAIDVRVEAPIPGKSAIGIEVPNDVVQMVSLRECLATNEFMSAPSKLTFALGKDIAGVYKYADLARMPHLLIGGSTNSGKSVCLNIIISSILYRATPREVKFVMIDPKRVELSLYDGIPHLLSPVIKDVRLAAGILRSVLKEMDERYDRFAHIGTRNLDGYNNRVPPEERLPFIVVVLDELADLMMQQGPEVEMSICRLAQLARATGIHLVIATQRPSVDVITGTIKANISSRIAFTVATQVDSRTIIDMPGAERLIGRGDMLFLPIDAPKPIRVQGCYVGERETEAVVTYLRDQEEAVYTMIPSEISPSGADPFDEDDPTTDELFEPCVRWLVMQGQCSTSSLQRKFKIGYTRAARLVESMEAMQIVGPQDGVKPREILLRKENVEAFFAGRDQGDLGQ
jgi:S-DNA-T family DNA segregation ATPase FtsK/SpoIIIE